jgi:hypothetical protein
VNNTDFYATPVWVYRISLYTPGGQKIDHSRAFGPQLVPPEEIWMPVPDTGKWVHARITEHGPGNR